MAPKEEFAEVLGRDVASRDVARSTLDTLQQKYPQVHLTGNEVQNIVSKAASPDRTSQQTANEVAKQFYAVVRVQEIKSGHQADGKLAEKIRQEEVLKPTSLASGPKATETGELRIDMDGKTYLISYNLKVPAKNPNEDQQFYATVNQAAQNAIDETIKGKAGDPWSVFKALDLMGGKTVTQVTEINGNKNMDFDSFISAMERYEDQKGAVIKFISVSKKEA